MANKKGDIAFRLITGAIVAAEVVGISSKILKEPKQSETAPIVQSAPASIVDPAPSEKFVLLPSVGKLEDLYGQPFDPAEDFKKRASKIVGIPPFNHDAYAKEHLKSPEFMKETLSMPFKEQTEFVEKGMVLYEEIHFLKRIEQQLPSFDKENPGSQIAIKYFHPDSKGSLSTVAESGGVNAESQATVRDGDVHLNMNTPDMSYALLHSELEKKRIELDGMKPKLEVLIADHMGKALTRVTGRPAPTQQLAFSDDGFPMIDCSDEKGTLVFSIMYERAKTGGRLIESGIDNLSKSYDYSCVFSGAQGFAADNFPVDAIGMTQKPDDALFTIGHEMGHNMLGFPIGRENEPLVSIASREAVNILLKEYYPLLKDPSLKGNDNEVAYFGERGKHPVYNWQDGKGDWHTETISILRNCSSDFKEFLGKLATLKDESEINGAILGCDQDNSYRNAREVHSEARRNELIAEKAARQEALIAEKEEFYKKQLFASLLALPTHIDYDEFTKANRKDDDYVRGVLDKASHWDRANAIKQVVRSDYYAVPSLSPRNQVILADSVRTALVEATGLEIPETQIVFLGGNANVSVFHCEDAAGNTVFNELYKGGRSDENHALYEFVGLNGQFCDFPREIGWFDYSVFTKNSGVDIVVPSQDAHSLMFAADQMFGNSVSFKDDEVTKTVSRIAGREAVDRLLAEYVPNKRKGWSQDMDSFLETGQYPFDAGWNDPSYNPTVIRLRNCSANFPEFLRRLEGEQSLDDVQDRLYKCLSEKDPGLRKAY
jgi:hypothetical protein